MVCPGRAAGFKAAAENGVIDRTAGARGCAVDGNQVAVGVVLQDPVHQSGAGMAEAGLAAQLAGVVAVLCLDAVAVGEAQGLSCRGIFNAGGKAAQPGGLAQAVGVVADALARWIVKAISMAFAVVAVAKREAVSVNGQGFSSKQAALVPLQAPAAGRQAADSTARGRLKLTIGVIAELLIGRPRRLELACQAIASVVLIADLAAGRQAELCRAAAGLGQAFGFPGQIAGTVVSKGGGCGFRAGVAV